MRTPSKNLMHSGDSDWQSLMAALEPPFLLFEHSPQPTC